MEDDVLTIAFKEGFEKEAASLGTQAKAMLGKMRGAGQDAAESVSDAASSAANTSLSDIGQKIKQAPGAVNQQVENLGGAEAGGLRSLLGAKGAATPQEYQAINRALGYGTVGAGGLGAGGAGYAAS